MGKQNHYTEELKWEAVRMRQQGMSHSQIQKKLGIKNKAQIQTWMRWLESGETYRFAQPVGKQYSYGKGASEGLSELEQLKLNYKRVSAELEIVKKYKEIERRWFQKQL